MLSFPNRFQILLVRGTAAEQTERIFVLLKLALRIYPFPLDGMSLAANPKMDEFTLRSISIATAVSQSIRSAINYDRF